MFIHPKIFRTIHLIILCRCDFCLFLYFKAPICVFFTHKIGVLDYCFETNCLVIFFEFLWFVLRLYYWFRRVKLKKSPRNSEGNFCINETV